MKTGRSTMRIEVAECYLSAPARGLIAELRQMLEIIIPLQYENVSLHSPEAQDARYCRSLLAASMSVLVSDYPFLR